MPKRFNIKSESWPYFAFLSVHQLNIDYWGEICLVPVGIDPVIIALVGDWKDLDGLRMKAFEETCKFSFDRSQLGAFVCFSTTNEANRSAGKWSKWS